jgi:hypothetical protein
MPTLASNCDSAWLHRVHGVQRAQDVECRFQGVLGVGEHGKQVVGFLLDDFAPVGGNGGAGGLLHAVDQCQEVDDSVAGCDAREAAHVQHQHGHRAHKGLGDGVVDLRPLLGLLVALGQQTLQGLAVVCARGNAARERWGSLVRGHSGEAAHTAP